MSIDGLNYNTIKCLLSAYLDLVTSEQKGQIEKAFSQQLFKWLVDVGRSEDEAEKLSR